MIKRIKLSKYRGNGAKIFTDRDNGVKARKELELNELDNGTDTIYVVLPSDTWGINPSFFGGLFEESVKKFGDNFRDKYVFVYSQDKEIGESLNKDIDYDIDYVLRNMEGMNE